LMYSYDGLNLHPYRSGEKFAGKLSALS